MEDGGAKPFDTVTIVLLMIVAVVDDTTTLIGLLGIAVPVLGEIIFAVDRLTAIAAWIIIQGTFAFKLRSFGSPGIVNMIGGVLEEASIPATTITTFAAIQLANHPKIAKVTGVVGGAAVGGAVGELAGAGGAAKGGTAAKATAIKGPSAEATGEVAVSGRPSEAGTGVKPSEAKKIPADDNRGEGGKKEITEEAFGMPAEPFEQAEEEVGLKGELPKGNITPFRPKPQENPENTKRDRGNLPKAA